MGAREVSSRWVGKSTAFPLYPCFKTPSQPCHPAPFASASQALLPSPAPPPSVPGSHAGPSSEPAIHPFPRLLWHSFQLFILPNWRPTPAAPQCAPQPVQQILRKARPALAGPLPPGGEGAGPGAAPASPALPVRAALTEPAGPARRAAGREAGGARRRGRFPGVAAAGAVPEPGSPFGPARRGQTLDVAKSPPLHSLLCRARALSAR